MTTVAAAIAILAVVGALDRSVFPRFYSEILDVVVGPRCDRTEPRPYTVEMLVTALRSTRYGDEATIHHRANYCSDDTAGFVSSPAEWVDGRSYLDCKLEARPHEGYEELEVISGPPDVTHMVVGNIECFLNISLTSKDVFREEAELRRALASIARTAA